MRKAKKLSAEIMSSIRWSGFFGVFCGFLQPDDEARELNDLMLEKLLELDDVDAVYSNQN